ncbi:unnamed protein product [Ectocarpus sp. 6 AP-2014]
MGGREGVRGFREINQAPPHTKQVKIPYATPLSVQQHLFNTKTVEQVDNSQNDIYYRAAESFEHQTNIYNYSGTTAHLKRHTSTPTGTGTRPTAVCTICSPLRKGNKACEEKKDANIHVISSALFTPQNHT